MSLLEMPAALAREAAGEADQAQAPMAYQWIEPALAVAFAVAAVVFASSLAVVTGLV
jgi:hypothetical protein